MSGTELIYSRGMLSVEQITAEINIFWNELESDENLQSELNANGFNRQELADISRSRGIAIRAGRSGVDPVSAVLIVALAPTGNRILQDLWKTVVLPRIKRRWGDDAIGPEKSEKDEKS